MTPGSAAAACAAAFEGIRYEGLAVNEKHKNWLDNIMDKAIYAIVDARKSKTEVGGIIGSDVLDSVRVYFQTLIDEGGRYLEAPGSDSDEDDDAEDDGSD